MKKYLFLLACCCMFGITRAQLINEEQKSKKQSDLDWFNCSFEEDGVYGAEINKAYDFLKNKKIKKKPVLALIGAGIDVEHEDLKEAIWKNHKEKNNGKDNDKNGLLGDVNGWNFLGGKNGAVMQKTMFEGDREFFRLKDKYGDYTFDGKNYFKVINGEKVKVAAPENLEEYNYYWRKVLPESRLAGAYGGYRFSFIIQAYANQFDKMMRERFSNRPLTRKEFETCYNPKAARDSLSEVAFMFLVMAFDIYKTDLWEDVYIPVKEGRQIATAKAEYEQALKKYGTDGRKEIVGDDYLNIKDDKYGNNVLLTSDAGIGTMEAGVIAAKRDNGLGMNGIMDEAQVMTLRVMGNEGEIYLKDYALAIRYAVDHGADIIMMQEQYTLYPPAQKKWVIDALRYAESKGVLIIVPTSEWAIDLSKMETFPNRKMDGEKELTNLLVVASSDKQGNPSVNSNYGMGVDLFAPGIDVYSTYTGDTYQKGTGVGISAATAAGVAALIKAYYPALNGSQIRQLLLDNVTARTDVEVEKGIRVDDQLTQDLFLFEDLCLSGGILNAYKAIVAASKM